MQQPWHLNPGDFNEPLMRAISIKMKQQLRISIGIDITKSAIQLVVFYSSNDKNRCILQ